MPTYDPETREWVVVDQATGEAKRFAESDYASAIAYSRQVNPPAEADVAVDQPSVAFRTAHRREYDQLQTWNQQQKEAGGIQLSEADAQQAMGYMDSLGLSFFQSLNLYSQYIGSKQNVPGPSEVEGPVVITPAEINRLRGIAGAPPFAVSPVAGESFFQTNAPTTGLPAGAENTDVGKAILAVTSDPAIQAAMWHGATQEGGTEGPWGTAPGQNHVGGGGEVGPWQIHPVHFGDNIDAQSAADPYAAARWMLADYQNGVASVPTELWQVDPGGALVLAVANAERPQGWHEGLTVEEAVAIYGERATSGPIAPTGGGIGATGGYIPSTEDTWGKLNRAQQQAYYDLYAPRGMPMDYYVAAIEKQADPMAYWKRAKYIDLNQSLEDGRITWQEFEAADAYHMSGADVDFAKQLNVPIITVGQVLRDGGSYTEIAEAVSRGIDPIQYHQYAKVLTPEDFTKADLLNIPLPKMVEQKQLQLAEAQATDEFNQAWETQYTGTRPEYGMDPDINAYMNYRKEQERQRYVADRIIGINKAAKPGTVEAAIQQNPYAKNLPSDVTGVTPGPVLPDLFSLIEQGVREGQIAQYVPGREPVPGGRAEQPRSVARTARGGPPQVGGIPTGQEGGFLGFTTGGDIAAQQALARAYMAKPSVIPEGYTEDQWQAVLRARYPGAAPEEPLEEPLSDLERLNRGTKLQKARKRRPLAITG